jgi:hypothetical protein
MHYTHFALKQCERYDSFKRLALREVAQYTMSFQEFAPFVGFLFRVFGFLRLLSYLRAIRVPILALFEGLWGQGVVGWLACQ